MKFIATTLCALCLVALPITGLAGDGPEFPIHLNKRPACGVGFSSSVAGYACNLTNPSPETIVAAIKNGWDVKLVIMLVPQVSMVGPKIESFLRETHLNNITFQVGQMGGEDLVIVTMTPFAD